MSEKLNYLLILKKILKENEVISLLTKNKKTGWNGVASFLTNGEDMIRVNEGASDGSDDSDMSFNDFITNYNFIIGMEGCDYDETI